MADTGDVELDEALAGLEVLRLDDGVVVADLELGAGVGDDGGLLGLGDGVGGGHGADVGWESRRELGEALGTQKTRIYTLPLEPGRA